MKFTIEGKLTGANEYIRACRSKVPHVANKLKKDNESSVKIAAVISHIKPVKNYPVRLNITYYEPNKRRDVDNVGFGAKFILDALVGLGLLENDNQSHVSGISYEVKCDKYYPRIEVTINELDRDDNGRSD